MSLSLFINAQNNDSTVLQENTIVISENNVSVKAVETIVEIQQLHDRLITEQELDSINSQNQRFISGIQLDYDNEPDSEYKSKTPRFLINRQNYWNRHLTEINSELQVLFLSSKRLNKNLQELKQESKIWNYNSQKMDSQLDAKKIKDVLKALKKEQQHIESKQSFLTSITDRTGILKIDVETKIVTIEEQLANIEQNIFNLEQLPLYKIPLVNSPLYNQENWRIKPHLKNDINELISYLLANKEVLLAHFIITLLLAFLFKKLRLNPELEHLSKNTFYLTHLQKIVSFPIITGLLFSLFSSILLYKNAPVIFIDFIRNLLLIPTVILLVKILNPKYHRYIFGIALLLLLHQVETMLPSDNHFSRFFLLFIGCLELILLIPFHNLTPRLFDHSPIQKAVRLISKTLIAFTCLGILANIAGATILSQISLTAVAKILNATITIVLAIIIVNGTCLILIKSPQVQKFSVIQKYGHTIKHQLIRMLNIAAILFWSYTFFSLIYLDEFVLGIFDGMMTYTVSFGSVSFQIGNILSFVFVIWLSTVLSRLIRTLLKEDILSKFELDKGMPHTIATMIQYALVTLGILFATNVAGIPTDSLAIVLGAMSVGIGFGLQNIFNNLVSGLILLFERPIKLGDTIEAGSTLGTVKSMGIRSSNVRTFDGAEIIIPNGDLISKDVVNWTLSDQKKRICVEVGISYDADPHKAEKLFRSIITNHEAILNYPKPSILFHEFGDSSLNFKILFWTSDIDNWLLLKSEITFAVFDILKQEGIEIPFPQRDIHIRSQE